MVVDLRIGGRPGSFAALTVECNDFPFDSVGGVTLVRVRRYLWSARGGYSTCSWRLEGYASCGITLFTEMLAGKSHDPWTSPPGSTSTYRHHIKCFSNLTWFLLLLFIFRCQPTWFASFLLRSGKRSAASPCKSIGKGDVVIVLTSLRTSRVIKVVLESSTKTRSGFYRFWWEFVESYVSVEGQLHHLIWRARVMLVLCFPHHHELGSSW